MKKRTFLILILVLLSYNFILARRYKYAVNDIKFCVTNYANGEFIEYNKLETLANKYNINGVKIND